MNLLTVVLLLPLAGFLVALAIPRSAPQASRNWALGVSLATFLASLGLLAWFDRGIARRAVHRRPAVDRHARDPLPHRRRWRQPVAGAALHVPHAHLRADFLALHPEPRQGVLRLPAAAGIRPGGRLHGAGPVPVLRVLGSLAGAHVLPDRHLGPRAAHLRGGEVLPLHHGRLGADAGGHHLPLQPGADLQLLRPSWTCWPAAG